MLFDAEGRAKIADFGIARMGGGGTLTEAGTVLGTASYISPEQAAGRPASPASDVYSFGVILFRMLTGRLPFVSRERDGARADAPRRPAAAVADVRADAPARLAALATAVARQGPAERPADGAALVRELRGTAGDATASSRPRVSADRRRCDAGAAAGCNTAAPAGAARCRSGSRRSLSCCVGAGAALALAFVTTRDGDSSRPPTTSPLDRPSVCRPPRPHGVDGERHDHRRLDDRQTTTAPTTTAGATTRRRDHAPADRPSTATRRRRCSRTTTVAPPPTTTVRADQRRRRP